MFPISVQTPQRRQYKDGANSHHTHTHTQTHKYTHTTFGSGRTGCLMESCFFFFLLLSVFPQTPCLPCQENNESTKPIVRMTSQYFHLHCPPNPPTPTDNPQCIYIFPILSRYCLTCIAHPSPACLPALLLAACSQQQVFHVFLSGQDVLKIRLSLDWEDGVIEAGREVWSARKRPRQGRAARSARHYQLLLTL